MSPEALRRRRDVAAELVSVVAAEALAFFERRADFVIETKRPRDFVTHADRTIERRVRALIAERFPGETVIGEEEGGEESASYWIIDPIDGTSNFLAGSPLWGVSLAYVLDGEPVVGAIEAPVLREAMSGAKGQGLLFNGASFDPNRRPPSLGIVSLGDSADDDLAGMTTLSEQLRRAGWYAHSYHCTSVSMMFAALGRLDGHLQPTTTMWDAGAGVVLCREAGLRADLVREADHLGVWAGLPEIMMVVRPNAAGQDAEESTANDLAGL